MCPAVSASRARGRRRPARLATPSTDRTMLDGAAAGDAFGTRDETSVGAGLPADIDGTLPGRRDVVLLTRIFGHRFAPWHPATERRVRPG